MKKYWYVVAVALLLILRSSVSVNAQTTSSGTSETVNRSDYYNNNRMNYNYLGLLGLLGLYGFRNRRNDSVNVDRKPSVH